MPVPCVCQNPVCGKTFPANPGNSNLYCSRACYYAVCGPSPILERLQTRITICMHGPFCPFCCFEWQGTKDPNGYGRISVKEEGRWHTRLVHRMIWEHANKRRMPAHLGTLHHCDNPPCTNLWHLYPGTQRHNTQDAHARGRYIDVQYAHGDSHYLSKLKTKDIPHMFLLREQGMTLRALAQYFGVSKGTITSALSQRTWKHASP